MRERFSLSNLVALQLAYSLLSASAVLLVLILVGVGQIEAAPGRLAEPLDGEVAPLPIEEAEVADAPRDHVDLYGDPLDLGAISRLGTVRYRHPGWHKKIDFLPDNKTIVVGNREGGIRYWDARSGKMVHKFKLGDDQFDAYRLSYDGSLLATLSSRYPVTPGDRTFQTHLDVWDAKTREKIQRIEWQEQLSSSSAAIAISPDGKYVATASHDGVIRIWKRATSEVFLKLEPKNDEIESLEFSPAGGLLAMASRRGVSLWSYDTTQPPRKLDGLGEGAQGVRFSPDGSVLAVSYRAAVILYDTSTRELIYTLRDVGTDYIGGVLFGADGKQLLVPVMDENVLKFFDVRSGKLVRSVDAGSTDPQGVALSSDLRLLACIGSEAVIPVWDLEAGERISDRFVGHLNGVQDIRFTRDGEQVLTAGMEGTIGIWDPNTGRQLRHLQHDYWIAGLAVSPDDRWIASSGFDDTVRLWEMSTGKEKYRLPGHGRTGGNTTSEVVFSPDGTKFYSFGNDFYLRSYRSDSGRILSEYAIRPSGVKLEENDDGELTINAPGGMMREDRIEQVAINSTAKLLVLSSGSDVYLFDTETGQEVDVIHLEKPCQRLVLSPDGTMLLSVEMDSNTRPDPKEPPQRIFSLRVRSLKSKEVVREVQLPGRFAFGMAISPDGSRIAAAQSDAVWTRSARYWVGIYDSKDLNLVARVGKTFQQPRCLELSADGSQLAASYGDSTVTIWDVQAFDADGIKN